MEIHLLILDDEIDSVYPPLARALEPFASLSPTDLRDDLESGATVELNGLAVDPVRLRLSGNLSPDPERAAAELENGDGDPVDLVLLDDRWGEAAAEQSAGQEHLLPIVFERVPGLVDDLPLIALYTRNWGDANRIDRFTSILRRPPYWGSNRVTGLPKEDAHALRLLLQRVVAQREILARVDQLEAREEDLTRLLRARGVPSVENLPLKSPSPILVGSSMPMRILYWEIERWARFDFPVHIRGEQGTGKTRTADAIHQLSHRRKNGKVLQRLDLNSPPELVDSALFGISEGTASGVKRRVGQLEKANGGTLFLDNVDLMLPEIQVKLLRFFEDGEYQRVAEAETQRSDVRIISASNRNVLELVKEGKFREDLYSRLGIDNAIEVPPLRRRLDDLPEIIRRLIGATKEMKGLAFTAEAIRRLQIEPWTPGNIRDLRTFLQKVMVYRPDTGPVEARTVEDLLGGRSSGRTYHPDPSAASPGTAGEPDDSSVVRRKLQCIEDLLVRGDEPMDIGPVLNGRPRNGRQTLHNFLKNKATMDYFTHLGAKRARSLFPRLLEKLASEWRSDLSHRGYSYPAWVWTSEGPA